MNEERLIITPREAAGESIRNDLQDPNTKPDLRPIIQAYTTYMEAEFGMVFAPLDYLQGSLNLFGQIKLELEEPPGVLSEELTQALREFVGNLNLKEVEDAGEEETSGTSEDDK